MDNEEKVINVKLSQLRPFPDSPFRLREDESFVHTVESIKSYGVLVPAIVRPVGNDQFEIISGHRRKRACELAGIKEMPVIVRELDDCSATIMMIDSNLQREEILPSEKARAYKMKLDAIKHQGFRTDLTSAQSGQMRERATSRSRIAESSPDSSSQIQRYIRLTELVPGLVQLVDMKRIGLGPAVELSYLSEEEQRMLLETIDSEQATPSVSQAQRMRKLSASGELDEDSILHIMLEQKKPEAWNISIPIEKLTKYFPSSYTPQRMEETIFRLLESWDKANRMSRNRGALR